MYRIMMVYFMLVCCVVVLMHSWLVFTKCFMLNHHWLSRLCCYDECVQRETIILSGHQIVSNITTIVYILCLVRLCACVQLGDSLGLLQVFWEKYYNNIHFSGIVVAVLVVSKVLFTFVLYYKFPETFPSENFPKYSGITHTSLLSKMKVFLLKKKSEMC